MKYILEYEDVKDVFGNATIWINQYEVYWFQYAWSFLEKEGLTTYSNSLEEHEVTLCAYGLIKSYYDFCEAVFDECNEEGFSAILNDTFSGSELIVGQLYTKEFPQEDFVEDTAEALESLVNKYQHRVNKAIRKHLTESEVFVWMYCSADTPHKYEPTDDDDYEETDYEINNFEDYKAMIEDASHEILNNPQKDEMYVGLEYVHNNL